MPLAFFRFCRNVAGAGVDTPCHSGFTRLWRVHPPIVCVFSFFERITKYALLFVRSTLPYRTVVHFFRMDDREKYTLSPKLNSFYLLISFSNAIFKMHYDKLLSQLMRNVYIILAQNENPLSTNHAKIESCRKKTSSPAKNITIYFF